MCIKKNFNNRSGPEEFGWQSNVLTISKNLELSRDQLTDQAWPSGLELSTSSKTNTMAKP